MKIVKIFILLVLLPISVFAQWFPQNSGTNADLYHLQFINTTTGWAVGDYKIYKTINSGNDWFIQTDQDTMQITSFFFLNENIGWYTWERWDYSGVCKTTDGGLSWSLVFTTIQFVHLTDIQFTDSLNGYCVGCWQLGIGYIYKTTDGGLTWTYTVGGMNLAALHFLNTDTGWVAGSNILKTTDAGLNWDEQLNLSLLTLYSIQFVDSNIGWALVIPWIGDGIYKTTDSGQAWFQQSTMNFSSIYFSDALNGWAVSDSNIYQSNNGGDNWTLQISNTNKNLNDIIFVDQKYGWAVGENGTILHTTTGGVVSVKEEEIDEIPTEFLLSQNWPNPFNGTSVIRYSVPQSSDVVIKVFDVLGNEIETLVNEEKPIGTYEITWTAENLPSGIYLYQLRSGSYLQTRKMVLMK